MCMFSQPIDHVGSTRIFVSGLSDAVHATVYRMAYQAHEAVAMILPVPVLKGTGDEALTFVDLSECRDFFEELDLCFPVTRSLGGGGYGGGGHSGLKSMLEVHEVGDYVASYVPSISEFDRLDPRFRLPKAVWETLPDYHDFGFAVFQLRPGDEPQEVQPIAYRYPAEQPGELFFPTVHLHDGGSAHPRADFDHVLYAQPFHKPPDVRGMDWQFSPIPPREVMNLDRTKGLVVGDRPVARSFVRGEYPNADLVMQTDEGWPIVEARLVRDPGGVGSVMKWREFQKLQTGRYNRGSSF